MVFSESIDIPPELIIAWKMSEAAWCVKDTDRKLVFTNEKYNNLIIPNKETKKSALSFFSDYIVRHDSKVMEEKRKIDAIGIFPAPYINELSIFFCERMPYYNREAKVVGVASRITPLTCLTPLFFVSGEGKGMLTTARPAEFFTEKEWVVVFLLLLGFCEKDISRKLNRTLRTIKFHKSNILQKTACETTNEFIQFARQHKWQFSVPPKFSKPCYIIT